MNATNDNTAPKGLRQRWATPPRTGLARWIAPWEYRRVRTFGILRIAGGLVAVAAGLICLSYAAYGWAAFFLAVGVLNLATGYWELTIARSQSLRA